MLKLKFSDAEGQAKNASRSAREISEPNGKALNLEKVRGACSAILFKISYRPKAISSTLHTTY